MTTPLELGLYVITDSRLGRGRSLVVQAAAAIAGGADVIQLREKELSTAELVDVGRALRALTRQTGTLLIVNDRVDVARVIEADGVHLGQDDMRAGDARVILGPNAIIGVSAGNASEFALVREQGADYVGVGPVAVTGSKTDAGAAIGPEGVAAVRALTALPIVAIGGITADNAEAALRAGADGVAVITAVVGQDDVTAAARRLKAIVSRSRHARP